MSFRPISDRIFCKQISEESKSQGGIILPSAQQSANLQFLCKFEVLDVGPGRSKPDGTIDPMHVKKGDILWGFKKYDVLVDGKTFSVIDESCIVGMENIS
jgi:chaperonin GroES